MQLLTLGLNHVTAPVALRERVAFSPDQMLPALQQLHDVLHRAQRQHETAHTIETAILSTCNRTEIYCAYAHTETATAIALNLSDDLVLNLLRTWLAQYHQVPLSELSPHLYALSQQQAIRHSFRVASGLNSMVLGEPQILGQMKQALRDAMETGNCGSHLHQLFQRTFAVAKEVRSRTEIGAHSMSMAAAGVKLAQRIFDDLHQVKVLLVGAGEMIELCAAHFSWQQPQHLVVANRTLERAQTLAQTYHGQAMRLGELPQHIAEFDVVISCTASTLPLIGLGMMESALKERKHRPIMMLDLAVPRDIEVEVAQLDDIFLYTLDDLSALVQQGSEQRQAAITHAETLIEHHVQQFTRWLETRSVLPTVRDLQISVENLRQRELRHAEKLLAQGHDVNQVLERFSQRLTKKFLHGPLHLLNKGADEERQQLLQLLPQWMPDAPRNRKKSDPHE